MWRLLGGLIVVLGLLGFLVYIDTRPMELEGAEAAERITLYFGGEPETLLGPHKRAPQCFSRPNSHKLFMRFDASEDLVNRIVRRKGLSKRDQPQQRPFGPGNPRLPEWWLPSYSGTSQWSGKSLEMWFDREGGQCFAVMDGG